MEKEYTKLIAALFKMVRTDARYKALNEEHKILEEELEEAVLQLPQQTQDLIWAFVCHSESMNWCMLEIICEKMQIWRADL